MKIPFSPRMKIKLHINIVIDKGFEMMSFYMWHLTHFIEFSHGLKLTNYWCFYPVLKDDDHSDATGGARDVYASLQAQASIWEQVRLIMP